MARRTEYADIYGIIALIAGEKQVLAFTCTDCERTAAANAVCSTTAPVGTRLTLFHCLQLYYWWVKGMK